MIAIRLGLYLSLMVLMGLAAFPLYALRGEERDEGRILTLRNALIFWSAVAILLSLLGFFALVAAMLGTSVLSVDWQTSRSVLLETPIGAASMVRMAAVTSALYAACAVKRADLKLIAVSVSSAIALATLVWTGHAGATEAPLGSLHKASDILHMLAAAIWLGGIAAFLKMLQEPSDQLWGDRLVVAHRALDEFSRAGALCVTVIVVTGLINGQILVGLANLPGLLNNTYGQLLLLKFLLVGAMLALAAKNRWRLTPDLGVSLAQGSQSAPVAALRASLLLEAAAAVAILALVSWLGTLEPTASMRASLSNQGRANEATIAKEISASNSYLMLA